MKSKIIIGTRGSALALWQTNWIQNKLQKLAPERQFEVRRIKTSGDKIPDAPLVQIGGKGLFVKELELALHSGEIDIAVHSMKDMPTILPDGLTIGAIAQRADPSDALVSHKGFKFTDLPLSAKVGTSSLRRRAQLLQSRPDLNIHNLRGNIDTRIAKLKNEKFDAIILATAGVQRLGFEELITEQLPYEICLPAVGQGAIGIENRDDDMELLELVSKINHLESAVAVTAERAMLAELGGGCQIPIAALGRVSKGKLKVEGLVAAVDGSRIVRSSVCGELSDADALGKQLAKQLLDIGAESILRGNLTEQV
ncbi:TPA: hydroxymethylbilane synthase [Candidatus Poribacteria bacterium]|nr:hydroxymethylbilane synthase [Candidatus Poribacteria bacterium]